MKIDVGNEIWISGGGINPSTHINTDVGICMYKGRVYLYNRTNRYWHNSSRGNVVELRNYYGKKIKDAGTKEIDDYSPKYWEYMRLEGREIPQKVIDFYNKLKSYNK